MPFCVITALAGDGFDTAIVQPVPAPLSDFMSSCCGSEPCVAGREGSEGCVREGRKLFKVDPNDY